MYEHFYEPLYICVYSCYARRGKTRIFLFSFFFFVVVSRRADRHEQRETSKPSHRQSLAQTLSPGEFSRGIKSITPVLSRVKRSRPRDPCFLSLCPSFATLRASWPGNFQTLCTRSKNGKLRIIDERQYLFHPARTGLGFVGDGRTLGRFLFGTKHRKNGRRRSCLEICDLLARHGERKTFCRVIISRSRRSNDRLLVAGR